MSVHLYEEALVERLRQITGDGRIHVITPDSAIRYFALFDKDKVQLPAVVISRGAVSLQDYRNQAVSLKGQTARVNGEGYVVKAKLIPARFEWQIDVFAADRYTCDEIIRELIFYFITYPRFEVKVPYDLGISQNFDVLLQPSIEDNSDLVEFPSRGECYRETITIYTENGHFFSSGKQYPVYSKNSDVDTLNKSNKGDEIGNA